MSMKGDAMLTLDFDPEPQVARSVRALARREGLAQFVITEKAVAAAMAAYDSGASVSEAVDVGRRLLRSWLSHPAQARVDHRPDEVRPRVS